VAPQEWHYRQVVRADTDFRARDMLLAVLRLALRVGLRRLEDPSEARDLRVSLALDAELRGAGLGLDDSFLRVARDVLLTDLAAQESPVSRRVLIRVQEETAPS
jgi:hypothetical protein